MTAFYKLSGAGNDFLALVEPAATPSAGEISAWCRRGVSLGADGLFVLSRSGDDVRMVHYNADGGRSELCLNGSRCAARLALELGWGGDGEVTLVTDAGALTGLRLEGGEVEMTLPAIVGEPAPVSLPAGSQHHPGWTLRVGVPHLVLPWPVGLGEAPVAGLGPVLRSHPELGPAGANVNFVRFVAPDRFEIRTFERGVEAETLACGTGMVASAAVGVANRRLQLPATALTSGGFELRLGGEVEDGSLRRVTLAGDARILARGDVLPAAAAAPTTPVWS